MNQPSAAPPRRMSGQTIFLAASIVVGVVVLGGLVLLGHRPRNGDAAEQAPLRLENIPFNGTRTYEYLKQLVAIGPRPAASAGMAAQQQLLANHFQKLGARVEFQRFRARHPLDGSEVHMANIIVRWNPESRDRLLLCAHYDTLPLPMEDRDNPRGTFVGANDNASGVAILMELGNEFAQKPPPTGVDFVFLDGEEYIFSTQDRYFLGSEFFARTYAESNPPYRYRWGVLLDMVGDADLQIFEEQHSIGWPDTRPLVEKLWATAARLGVREFVARVKYDVRDDHVPLHDIGKIPICDVIDFDYPPWHTQGDTADKCSPLSLAKVGWVISQWVRSGP